MIAQPEILRQQNEDQLRERQAELRPAISGKDGSAFIRIPLDQIVERPQHRQQFDENDLRLLAASMLDTGGVIQPVVVTRSAPDRFTLIAGFRRFRAAKVADLQEIDAKVLPDGLTEGDLLRIEISENKHRSNLNPIEEAGSFQTLMELEGMNGLQVAQFISANPSKVSRSLALLDLPREVQDLIASGKLSASKALRDAKKVKKPREPSKKLVSRKHISTQGITVVVSSRSGLHDADVVSALRELLATLEAATVEEVSTC